MTCVEESCVARHHVHANIIRIDTTNYASQFKSKGNIIMFPQQPESILNSLPNLPRKDLFQVTFVGKNRPNPTQVKQLLRVRRDEIEWVLKYLKENNWLWENVQICDTKLSQLPVDDVHSEMVENFIYTNQIENHDIVNKKM